MAKRRAGTNPLGDFWGPSLRGDIPDPASDAEIERTQRTLGITLPAEYVAALRVRNGGSLRRTSFKLAAPERKVYGRKTYSLTRLAGVHPTHADGLTQLTALARDEWELPPGLIPLDGDGHDWCCLDTRADAAAAVITHARPESGEEFRVAGSFAELVEGLYRDIENMTPALIALDEGAPRGESLSRTLASLGCTVYEYPGVVSHPDHALPPTWHWPEFRGLLKKSPVWITSEPNRQYRVSLVKTSQRPSNHPMLTVAVHPDDEGACLRRLLEALGPGVNMIHGVQ